MIFSRTKLEGAFIIDLEPKADQRGFFARAWCKNEFEAYNLNTDLVQINIGFSSKKGTLRGMHLQRAPMAEVKLVRCTRGAVYDVIVDLRHDSSTYKHWIGVELSQDNHRMLYIPEGFAHGYQSLSDEAEIYYQTSQFYSPEHAAGIRYDDPTFGISWPLPVAVISAQDMNWPDYEDGFLSFDLNSLSFRGQNDHTG